MPWERYFWIPSCSKFPTIRWYESTHNGATKVMPINGSSNESSQMHVREMALKNELVTRNIFVLPFDVRNLTKKQADELWQKHHKDPINVKMWVLKNLNLVFFYVQHAPMDFNSQI
jgi:hypothetical protein